MRQQRSNTQCVQQVRSTPYWYKVVAVLALLMLMCAPLQPVLATTDDLSGNETTEVTMESLTSASTEDSVDELSTTVDSSLSQDSPESMGDQQDDPGIIGTDVIETSDSSGSNADNYTEIEENLDTNSSSSSSTPSSIEESAPDQASEDADDEASKEAATSTDQILESSPESDTEEPTDITEIKETQSSEENSDMTPGINSTNEESLATSTQGIVEEP